MIVESNYISILTRHSPAHWDSYRIGSVFVERTEKVSDEDYAPLSVTMKGVVPQLENVAKTTNGENRKRVCINDFVINSRSDRKGSGGMSKYDGSVSLINTVLKPNTKYDNRYTNYLLTNVLFQEEFYKFGKGIVDDMWSTKYFDMKYIKVPCPPIEEQIAIANYLDKLSKKIKHFIQKKQAFIELLKEQRQAVSFDRIHQDGIEKGYPQRRIKSFAQILRGKFSHRPRNDQRLYDGDFPFIQTGDVSQANKYIESYKQTLNEWGYSVSKEFPKGTLCLTIAANVGDVAILNFNACFPDSIIGIVPNSEVDLDYLYYALKSFKAKFISESTLTTQYNLNIEKVGPIKIPLPNLDEQLNIVSRIKIDTAKIDQAIAKAEKEIELIKEYREAMIAEAVLGKAKINTTVNAQ